MNKLLQGQQLSLLEAIEVIVETLQTHLYFCVYCDKREIKVGMYGTNPYLITCTECGELMIRVGEMK